MEVEKYLLIYQIKSREKNLIILGVEFVNANKMKGKLILQNKLLSLRSSISIQHIKTQYLKIQLLLNKNISNIAYMFKESKNLLKIKYKGNIYYKNDNQLFEENNPYIIHTKNNEEIIQYKDNTVSSSNEEDADYESNSPPFISYQSDIKEKENNQSSEINITSESIITTIFNDIPGGVITNIKGMFYKCQSLIEIPDISEFNTENVFDMSEIFYGCTSLKTLPDISKWNTENVIYMNKMFYKCCRLKLLPDISKWKTSNLSNMSEMFCECSNLEKLPDLSKWNTANVIYMKGIFAKCSRLNSLPDISEWNTDNVQYMNFMFKKCSNLLTLPNISNGILIKLLIWLECFYNVKHYCRYLIFPNGILLM